MWATSSPEIHHEKVVDGEECHLIVKSKITKSVKSSANSSCLQSVTQKDWRAQIVIITLFSAACIPLALWGEASHDEWRSVSQTLASTTIPADTSKTISSLPNVVLLYIDDQGYNDMGPHSTDFAKITPHINKLAQEGIWLTKYYGLHVCTPSRAALMTGKYPMSVGMQHGIIAGNDPWGLPLSHTIFPQFLKKVGNYRTYMLGKWHLGHFNALYTPLARGFDRFFGYFSGFESFFSHIAEINDCTIEHDCYHDLRDDWTPVWSNTYNTYLFDREANKIFDSHHLLANSSQAAFFLYYAIGNVHMPVQAPESVFRERKQELAGIPNLQRRTFAAMTIVLDDAVGNITSGLMRNDIYDSTFIIIASDNGANPTVSGSGSNWPLRGMKGSYWEGGVHVNALVRSSLIPQKLRGTTYDGLFHVTDWIPTFIGGVLGRKDMVRKEQWDGIDQWDALLQRSPPPRSVMVYNIDLDDNSNLTGAIRIGDMKLLVNVLKFPIWPVPDNNTLEVYEGAWANTKISDYLFNLTEDPTESNDLRETHPETFHNMYKKFSELRAMVTPPAFCGYAVNKEARKVFNATQFITPWTTEVVGSRCLEIGSDEEVAHHASQLCLYGLLPSDQCGRNESN